MIFRSLIPLHLSNQVQSLSPAACIFGSPQSNIIHSTRSVQRNRNLILIIDKDWAKIDHRWKTRHSGYGIDLYTFSTRVMLSLLCSCRWHYVKNIGHMVKDARKVLSLFFFILATNLPGVMPDFYFVFYALSNIHRRHK